VYRAARRAESSRPGAALDAAVFAGRVGGAGFLALDFAGRALAAAGFLAVAFFAGDRFFMRRTLHE
jgi:hypothetical protein